MIKFKTLIPLHIPAHFIGHLDDGSVAHVKWNSSDLLVLTELKIDDQRPVPTLADAIKAARP